MNRLIMIKPLIVLVFNKLFIFYSRVFSSFLVMQQRIRILLD